MKRWFTSRCLMKWSVPVLAFRILAVLVLLYVLSIAGGYVLWILGDDVAAQRCFQPTRWLLKSPPDWSLTVLAAGAALVLLFREEIRDLLNRTQINVGGANPPRTRPDSLPEQPSDARPLSPAPSSAEEENLS